LLRLLLPLNDQA